MRAVSSDLLPTKEATAKCSGFPGGAVRLQEESDRRTRNAALTGVHLKHFVLFPCNIFSVSPVFGETKTLPEKQQTSVN